LQAFYPVQAPLRESFVSPLHKAVNGIGRKPATDLGENMGANTGENKLDTLAKHHQSASCGRFSRPSPLSGKVLKKVEKVAGTFSTWKNQFKNYNKIYCGTFL
jgi:hypothetical protein